MRRVTQNRTATTLIEVLASCTIIAGSLAAVVPVFGGNRSQARIATDNQNLRTIAQLMATYAEEDPAGIIGPVHPRAFNYLGEGYAEYGGGPGAMSFEGWNQDFDPRTRPLNHLLYGRDFVNGQTTPGSDYFSAFRCAGEDRGWQKWPGFNGASLETEKPYFAANGTSFRMNNLLFFLNGSPYGCGIYGRRKVDVPAPSATVAFMEARAFQTLFTNDLWGLLPTRGELKGYHDRVAFFNVLFTDGHSAFSDFGDGTFYPRLPENQGLDVRGTWGRFDTLPAPQLFFTPPPALPPDAQIASGETLINKTPRAEK